MLQGKEAKAKRGELFTVVSPGYSREGNHIVKDPNRRVQNAIMLVFNKFQELGSIRQTYGWFIENHIELPANKPMGGQMKLVWKLPAQPFIHSILHNPLYAGAYCLWPPNPRESPCARRSAKTPTCYSNA